MRARPRNPPEPSHARPHCVRSRRTLGHMGMFISLTRRELAVPGIQRCPSAILGGTSRDWEEHMSQASSQQLKQVGERSQTFPLSQPCPTHTIQMRAAKASVLWAGLPPPRYYFSHSFSSSALHPGLHINKE